MPPASRITDMHACPMFTGPVPHVGGPILVPGGPTVLIGGLPAAGIGSTCSLCRPPGCCNKRFCDCINLRQTGSADWR